MDKLILSRSSYPMAILGSFDFLNCAFSYFISTNRIGMQDYFLDVHVINQIDSAGRKEGLGPALWC